LIDQTSQNLDHRKESWLAHLITCVHETEQAFGVSTGRLDNRCSLVAVLVSASVVHQWLHHEARLDEASGRFATEQVAKALTDSGPRWAGMLVPSILLQFSPNGCPDEPYEIIRFRRTQRGYMF
jgi:hypothetical protein